MSAIQTMNVALSHITQLKDVNTGSFSQIPCVNKYTRECFTHVHLGNYKQAHLLKFCVYKFHMQVEVGETIFPAQTVRNVCLCVCRKIRHNLKTPCISNMCFYIKWKYPSYLACRFPFFMGNIWKYYLYCTCWNLLNIIVIFEGFRSHQTCDVT